MPVAWMLLLPLEAFGYQIWVFGGGSGDPLDGLLGWPMEALGVHSLEFC